MKSFATLSVVALLLIACSSRATEVPAGPVSGHWFASGNPYNINGEIYVPAESILNIHQGVEVIFQGHYKFSVYGYLEAVGTDQDSILFTAADTTEGWHSIRFVNAPNGSYLSYCIVQYGNAYGGGVSGHYGGGIYCDDSNPVIHHSTIRRNSAEDGGGIFCDWWSSPIISRCTITENSAEDQAGGIGCCYGSPIIENCIICNNSSWYYGASWEGGGGGICCYAGSTSVNYCTFSGNWANYCGGAIFCDDDSYITLSHCTFNDNVSDYSGGGIYCEVNGSPGISHCTFAGNSAYYHGGGVYLYFNCDPIISDCTFRGNSAWWGGGICCWGSASPIIENCIIKDNSADHGGGIYGRIYPHPSIKNCTLSNNRADYSGGGIYCEGGSLSIDSCTISGNSAVSDGGGIICLENITFIMNNSSLYDNHAGTFGGGIFCDSTDATIENCTISLNSAAYQGSGMHFVNCNTTSINTIVANNMGGSGGIYFWHCHAISVSYGDCFGNQNSNYVGQVPTGLGELVTINTNCDSCDVFYNINLDPLFVDPAAGDFHLQADSPCIDAGDPTFAPDPDGTVTDMGRYYLDQGAITLVTLSLTPYNPPVQIPASGGSFDFDIAVSNGEAQQVTGQIWSDITLPDGSVYGPVIGPVMVTMASGWSADRDRTQNVPADAPSGTYTYNGYIGSYASTIWDQDTFDFEKLTAGDGLFVNYWANTGEPLEDWVVSCPEIAMAEDYLLSQNYPNPFNATTMLCFALLVPTFVKLEIFDVAGRNVEVHGDSPLFVGWRDAGYHEVTWDASNLPSGIYFYRIETNQFTVVKKMLLVK